MAACGAITGDAELRTPASLIVLVRGGDGAADGADAAADEGPAGRTGAGYGPDRRTGTSADDAAGECAGARRFAAAGEGGQGDEQQGGGGELTKHAGLLNLWDDRDIFRPPEHFNGNRHLGL